LDTLGIPVAKVTLDRYLLLGIEKHESIGASIEAILAPGAFFHRDSWNVETRMNLDGLHRAGLQAGIFCALNAYPGIVFILPVFNVHLNSGFFWIGEIGIMPIGADQLT